MIVDYSPSWMGEVKHPRVKMVREMMEHAKRAREKLENDWIENVRMLNGVFFDRPDFNMDRVEVNMFWSTARIITASTFMKEPYYLVRPRRPQDVAAAPIVEAVINHSVKSPSMALKKVVRQCTVDAMCFPRAWAKSGYVLEDIQIDVVIEKGSGKATLRDRTKQYDLAEHAIERRTVQVGSRPILNRVSPRAMWMDPRATSLDDAEWVCEEVVRHIDDVRADPAYRNTEGLMPTARASQGAALNQPFRTEFYGPLGRGTVGNESGPFAREPLAGTQYDSDLVLLWEFWHRPSRSLYVVSPFYPEPLREDEGQWPYAGEGYPYHTLDLTIPVPDELYPVPLFSVFKPQQRELNTFRSSQIDFVKRSRTKYLVDSGLIDPTSLAALQRGEGIPIVMVNGDPRTIVTPMEGPKMTPEFHKAMADIKDDMRLISGIAEYMRGGESGGEARTATEQRITAGFMSMVTDMARDHILDFCLSIGNTTLQHLRQFADRSEMIRISGRSDFEWREWSKKDIQGQYDLEIKAGSQLTTDPAVQRQQVLDMFSITAPIAIQTGRVDFDELLRILLRTYGDLVPDPERLITSDDAQKPPTDPHAEEMLLGQGGMPIGSVNDPHDLHLPVHIQGYQQAKSQEEAYRRLAHIKWHMDQKTQQMVSMMAQQQMQAQMGAPESAGGPKQNAPMGGGMMTGGQGRKAPAPGFPMAPGQFGQSPVDATTFSRGMSRREGV